ncbi:MAG: ABC transporter permease [Minisyncoccia bacterium]
MKFQHSFKTAIRGVRTHTSRSALTVLGIVIGVTAVIMVVAIGQGAQNLILAQIQGLGTKTIAVIPGRQPSGPADIAALFLDSLKEKDLVSLQKKENAPYLEDIMPLVFGPVRLLYNNDTYQTTMLGGGSMDTNDIMGRIFDVYPEAGGRFFSAEEVKSKASASLIEMPLLSITERFLAKSTSSCEETPKAIKKITNLAF